MSAFVLYSNAHFSSRIKTWGKGCKNCLSVFTLLAGCASSGYNLEEAISKWIAYPISDIVHIEELQEGAVVFYLSPSRFVLGWG